jgi:Uma2 family endonuclease
MIVTIPKKQRFIIDGVSWKRYTRLLREFADRHFRFTYDEGILEIMTLSHEHESAAAFLGQLVITLTQELQLPIKLGRSTTFRKRKKEKGLEPDDCYWIAHESDVRGKSKIDLRIDPPPDLCIEVDISRSSMDRMSIYAALGVPEVWRYNAKGLAFFILSVEGVYVSATTSPTFPLAIRPADLMRFMKMRGKMDENAVIHEFRAWIRRQSTQAPP